MTDRKAEVLGVFQEVSIQCVEMIRGHRLVVVPPDICVGLIVADRELVAG